MAFELRPGIQAIVYRNIGSKKEFLVLHRIKNWSGWEFPKGGVKNGEKYENAAIRELKEECNINKKDILHLWRTNYNVVINYPKEMWKESGYKGSLNKLFIIEIKKNAKCSIPKYNNEHDKLEWVLEEKINKYLCPELLKDLFISKKIIYGFRC